MNHSRDKSPIQSAASNSTVKGRVMPIGYREAHLIWKRAKWEKVENRSPLMIGTTFKLTFR